MVPGDVVGNHCVLFIWNAGKTTAKISANEELREVVFAFLADTFDKTKTSNDSIAGNDIAMHIITNVFLFF